MVRSIILGLVLVGLVSLAYVAYLDLNARRALTSGDVMPGPSESVTPSSALPPDGSSATNSRALQVSTSPSTIAGTTGVANPPSSEIYVPATDTISPNPPNGSVFAGSGRFEVYRQGNITWRIDTETGKNCVLFATNEEWHRPQVYQHGCMDSARRN